LQGSRRIELEPVGPLVTYLRNEASAIEQEETALGRLLGATNRYLTQMNSRLHASNALLTKAKNSGEEFVRVDSNVGDMGEQIIKRETLMAQLESGVDELKQNASEAKVLQQRYETRIANCKDDTADIQSRLQVELSALSRIVNSHIRFRCAALNRANIIHNDVLGRSTAHYSRVATTIEKQIMMYGVESGQAEVAFQGD